MADRIATGVRALDRQIGGGLPSGSLIMVEAPGGSQGERFVEQIAAGGDLLHLTAARPAALVDDEGSGQTIPLSPDRPGDELRKVLDSDSPWDRLVIEPIDVLEREDYPRYLELLQTLAKRAAMRNGMVFLHGLSGTAGDARELTKHMADVVMILEVERNGDEVESRLRIPKFRGQEPPGEQIKLDIGEAIRVDTSRDIA